MVSDLVLNKENKAATESNFKERVEKCGTLFELGLETFLKHHSQSNS